MTGDPANVGHARKLVVWVHIEDVLDGERGAQEVATSGVDDALGLTRRARGLEAGVKVRQARRGPGLT